MGGSTCHFSSGTGKKKHIDGRRDNESVHVVVDTRTVTAEAAEPRTAEFDAAVVRVALAASVMPLSVLETPDDNEAARTPLDLEEPALGYAAADRVRSAGIAATPEPAAATVFATGTALLVWHLRRRRAAAFRLDASQRIA